MGKTTVTTAQLQEDLRSILAQRNRDAKVKLVHDPEAVENLGGWVHLVVSPDREGLRAYDYVQELEKIERQLKQNTGHDELLVVPAMPD